MNSVWREAGEEPVSQGREEVSCKVGRARTLRVLDAVVPFVVLFVKPLDFGVSGEEVSMRVGNERRVV